MPQGHSNNGDNFFTLKRHRNHDEQTCAKCVFLIKPDKHSSSKLNTCQVTDPGKTTTIEDIDERCPKWEGSRHSLGSSREKYQPLIYEILI